MSKIWFRLFIFIIPVVVAVCVLEYKLRQAPTVYEYKRLQFESLQSEIKAVVLGSSHAAYNYIPEQMNISAYMLAHTSQSIEIDRKLFEKIEVNAPKLCFAILNLSYFSFEYRLAENSDRNRNYFYYEQYGFHGDSRWYEILSPRHWFRLPVFGAERVRNYLKQGEFQDSPVDLVTAYGGYDSSKSTEVRRPIGDIFGKHRAEYQTSTMNPALMNGNIQHIKFIAETMAKRGGLAVLVMAPAFQTYTKYLDQQKLQSFHKAVEALGLPFFNYLEDPRFLREDFLDNTHLNRQGADKFTQVVNTEILSGLDKRCQ